MINPWLERRLFELPIRPVLVEVQPEALEAVLGSFLGQGLGVRNVIRRFSMIGLVAVPSKLIQVIDALPGVRAVHADLQVNALQLPAAPNQALWYPTSESRNEMEAELAFRQGWTGEAVRLGVIDTGGSSRTLNNDSVHVGSGNAGAGDDSRGILVGSSAASPSPDDINLNAKILEGAGAGQLNYQAMVFNTSLTSIVGGYRYTFSRQVNNNSGADVTVREVGYVGRHTTTATDMSFLILHDLVEPEVTIPDGQARVFKYHLDFIA